MALAPSCCASVQWEFAMPRASIHPVLRTVQPYRSLSQDRCPGIPDSLSRRILQSGFPCCLIAERDQASKLLLQCPTTGLRHRPHKRCSYTGSRLEPQFQTFLRTVLEILLQAIASIQMYPLASPHSSQEFCIGAILPLSAGFTGSAPVMARNAINQCPLSNRILSSIRGTADSPMLMISL